MTRRSSGRVAVHRVDAEAPSSSEEEEDEEEDEEEEVEEEEEGEEEEAASVPRPALSLKLKKSAPGACKVCGKQGHIAGGSVSVYIYRSHLLILWRGDTLRLLSALARDYQPSLGRLPFNLIEASFEL